MESPREDPRHIITPDAFKVDAALLGMPLATPKRRAAALLLDLLLAANPGLKRILQTTANDFGLTIGWIELYFTFFLAWWSGQTPGKWLFGLQVVRLNGEPITLWLAFERFGGYAAGVATGLFGFIQVFWDANRQGIHDRISGTAVVRKKRTA